MQNKAPDPQSFHRVDHLANERTFLAWVRTSLGIMAFGFVVEKFALFMKQITYFLEKQNLANGLPHQPGFPPIFGVVLVIFGALIALFSYIRYKNAEKAIDSEQYQGSSALAALLTVAVVITGIFLAVYLF